MTQYLDYLTAILIGLLSTGHCLGMCGGIIAAISFKTGVKFKYLYHIIYNIGRIISYVIVTIIVNILGSFFFELGGYYTFLFKIISNLILIIIGLHITNIYNSMFFIESFLWHTWSIISRVIGNINFSKSIWYPLILGILWGGVPCGLIYSTIIWTAGFGSIIKSLILMMLFGLGTLPSMLFAGIFNIKFIKMFSNNVIKYIAGGIIIIFGLKNITALFFLQNCH